ncbi:MAG: DNA repair and recombination protein RadA [Candidatus Hydrothermarchaeales archaeon]
MDLKDLPGVGESTAEKLREAGFREITSIAAARPADLKDTAGIGEAAAMKIINAAKESLEIRFLSGKELQEKRKMVGRITTGSSTLNGLLGGGLETQAITELFGEFGSGKTQIAHQASVNVQLPKERGGLEKKAIYIDTENTFRPERIVQMAEALELDPDEILENISIAKAYNSDDQILWAEKVSEIAQGGGIGLVVVDSLTSQFRADYAGRGSLAERQQKLNRHIHTLQKIGFVNNIAIVVTNQVMARPDMFFGDPTAPIGGHVVGHTATFRIYLRKSKGGKRVARLIDSPCLPEGEVIFKVVKEGVMD